jgi:hypothetical protein
MQKLIKRELMLYRTAMSGAKPGNDKSAVLQHPMYLATSISPLALLQEKLLFKASFPNYAVVDVGIDLSTL